MSLTKKTVRAAFVSTFALLLVPAAFAVDPVVMWNGATRGFSSLTRTSGDNTYTLNLNGNSVDDNNSYVQIGDFNDQAGVTITVANANPAVTNGFGTDGAITVIMKCRNMPVNEENNRAIITLMDGRRYKYGGADEPDNGAVVGMYINNGTSGWIWKGSIAVMAGLSGDFLNTASGAFSLGEQTVALTYSNAGGTAYYVNGALIQSHSRLKASAELAAPYGVSLGGVDTGQGTQFHALPGMRIEAIAIFNATLSASEVAAFEFAQNTLQVSTINETYGSASEIDLEVDDGTLIHGDVSFNATKVNFICNGSITLTPPAGNTTAFDFSGVTGRTVIRYEGALPSVSGTTFTASTIPASVADPAQWTGTIWLRNIANVTNFNVNSYGNASSCVRLTGITGWLRAPDNSTYTNAVPVELSNEGSNTGSALKITNGNSANWSKPLRCTAFVRISGPGTLADETAAYPLIKVFDLSSFSGDIQLANASLVVCDPTTPYTNFYDMYGAHNGSLRIEEGKTVDVAWGKTWSFRNVACFGTPSGHGTIAVGGDLAPEGAFTNAAWMGTLSVTNLATVQPFNIHLLGNSGSTVALSAIGANGAYLPADDVEAGKVVLTDDGNGAALSLNDGFSNANTTFAELAGTGTFSQSKESIVQGLTINAMTDFTGTLSLNKMTVTFGTAKRRGQKYENGGWGLDESTAGKLFVDSDAVLSVPAGFLLWAPKAVVLDGPIDFKTDEANYKDLLLLDNLGSDVQIGPNFAVSINGTRLKDLPGGTSYKVKLAGDTLVLKRFGSALRFR